ncbi:MAG: NAD(P)/FAD-dependent oxidoreductase, partial [Ureaplasma sp.]|nr:NAD(P)/FAD-dependent oxidoreductase [Ureaplasma sp.]
MIYDLIVIGAGPVGLYSSFLSGYMKLKTLCIEIDKEVGGQPAKIYPKKEIYDFPCFNVITGQELIDKLFLQTKEFSEYVEIKTNTEITNYYIQDDIVVLKDISNNEYKTKYVLFTNNLGGYFPKKIDLDTNNTDIQISYCLQEKNEYENKNVVILGGGDAAVDYAIYIKKTFSPKQVYLIHHRDELSTKTKTVNQIKDCGISLLLNNKLNQVNKNSINIINVENNEEKTLNNIDKILVQYGV